MFFCCMNWFVSIAITLFMQSFILNKLSKTTKIFLTAAFLSLAVICLGVNAYAEDASLFKTISDDGQFSILKDLIQKTGLEPNLSKSDGDKYTLLAPNNQAFEKLPKPVLENLLKDENKDTLTKILNYHLVSGIINGVQIVSSKTVKTLEGSELNIKLTSSQILLNEKVNISKIDIKASNGVLHMIDEVLIPSSINIEALNSGSVAPAVQSNSNPASENSVEPSPVTTETPRTGSNWAIPVSVIIFGLIGAGLRFIVRPIKIKNS